MTNEMIERVSLAIAAKIMGEQVIDCDAAAKAAIEAMREPSAEQLKVGCDQYSLECNSNMFNFSSCISQAWRGMIDAALKE